MKPSPHITQPELEAYLSGKLGPEAKAKVDELLGECELSREAVAGFTAVPGAIDDLPALKQQIAARSGMQSPKKIWLNTIAGITIVAAAVIAYVAWPSKQPAPAVATPTVEQPQEPVVAAASPAPLTPQSEHFVNPEAKKPLAPRPHVVKKDSAASKTIALQPEPIEVDAPELLDTKPVVPQHPEIGYNASVGFVLDLKVTEFDTYYRQTIAVKEAPLPGVPAEFENEDSRGHEEKETVRQVPAEKFLVEGLQAFRDERYGRCIEKMEVLRKNNPEDLNAAFYMGISYVKLEMYGKALPLLDEVLNATNNVFHEEARWYKAQALLGMGNTEAAKALLSEIASKEGFYQQKAKALLK